MCRTNVLLLAAAVATAASLFVVPPVAQASVIIKTVPHANVKMEFGAHHVPPHDLALLDESAKVDGSTRLGIEVPHSQNHRNVLIHKIGTYLTVVMKALAKTVAPSQNQDGKTHFDIHVDADLGENDSKDKQDESPQFTIVQSKHGEEQIKGDCVKAVVIVSESDGDEHKSSEKHHKDEHSKDSHIVLHYNSDNSKESKDHQHHKSPERHHKDEQSKESHITFHYNSDNSKESKDHQHHKSPEIHHKDEQSKESHITFHYNSDNSKESKDHQHHKSSEGHHKDEHSKDSHITFHYNSDNSKESKDHQHLKSSEKHHKDETHTGFHHHSNDHKESKDHQHHRSSEKYLIDELKRQDSQVAFHLNSEHSKESKDHHEQNVHQVLEKKEDLSMVYQFQTPNDWETFKKTQEMLKEKGFILQLDKSLFVTKEKQQKSSQKAQMLDVKNKIKIALEGKSLSEEEMEDSERNWKSLEVIEADPEDMWISMINPTETNSRYQSHSEKNEAYSGNQPFSKTQTVHTSSVNGVSKEGKQIETIKATYQSGPLIVTTTKAVAEVLPNTNNAVTYEMVKQNTEKLSPTIAELSFISNEIPSQISTQFKQTSYSSDRSRAMTIISKEPAVDTNKEMVSQPAGFQVNDKLSVSHIKNQDDSHEVIMRLAPGSKTSSTKKAQIIDAKKVKIIKSKLPDEAKPDGTATRQENIRKLPMANIPTLIDVLQNAPPQEVQRLTQMASGGSSQEFQKDYASAEVRTPPVASSNITDTAPSKYLREYSSAEVRNSPVASSNVAVPSPKSPRVYSSAEVRNSPVASSNVADPLPSKSPRVYSSAEVRNSPVASSNVADPLPSKSPRVYSSAEVISSPVASNNVADPSPSKSPREYSSAEVINSPVASSNVADPSPSKSPREYSSAEVRNSPVASSNVAEPSPSKSPREYSSAEVRNSPVASSNVADPSPSKSPREYSSAEVRNSPVPSSNVADPSPSKSPREYSSAEVRNFPVASSNVAEPSPSKTPREFQLPKLHVSDLNSEERKDHSIEYLKSSVSSKAARNEKLDLFPQEIHMPKEEVITEAPSEKFTSEHSHGYFKYLEFPIKGNTEDQPGIEQPRSLKHTSDNPNTPKSIEVSVTIEPDRQQKELIIDSLNNGDGQTLEKNAKDNVDHQGEDNQNTVCNDTKKYLEEEDKGHNMPETIAIEDIGHDPRASHAFSLCSLTALAEEARALDISPHQVENQPAEVPITNSPVEEVAASPKNLNLGSQSLLPALEVSETAEKISELEKKVTPPSLTEEAGLKLEVIKDEQPSVDVYDIVHNEATPSDLHNVLTALSPVTEPSTTPSLPDQESISSPTHKERGLLLGDEPTMLVSNLIDINEALPVQEVDRDGRIYDSRLVSSFPQAPPPALLPDTTITTPVVPMNNAMHDPNSHFLYSYYPALHPKGVYPSQNKTEDAVGLYGKPSPRVICVNTGTGKLLGDSTNIGDQNNAVAKYSPEVNKNSKEDDKLMLLKLLHEDIQKLKMQLKVQ